VGAGCALVMACDVRVATPAARFGVTPAKLGLVYPMADLARLVALVGPGQARRLLFSARLIDAGEALAIGLIEEVADSPDALVAAVLAASRHSTRSLKGLLRRVQDGQREESAETRSLFEAAFTGADFAEGAAAFAERRPPHFKA
jgi:enoyl-CoA hydratase/carnithine racemase